MRAPFTPPTQPWAELKFLYERRKEEGRRKDPCLTMYLSKKKKKWVRQNSQVSILTSQ